MIIVLRASATLDIFLLDHCVPSFSNSRAIAYGLSWPLVFGLLVTCAATCDTRYCMRGADSVLTGAKSLHTETERCSKLIDAAKIEGYC